MAVTPLPVSGEEVPEPNWPRLIPAVPETAGDVDDWRTRAHEEWQRVTAAMRAAGTLGAENRHQIQRLVLAYLRYERAVAMTMELGAVVAAKRTKVPMLNLWQTEMRAADADATTAEMELGLNPRRRGSVTKKPAAKRAATAADGYLSKPA